MKDTFNIENQPNPSKEDTMINRPLRVFAVSILLFASSLFGFASTATAAPTHDIRTEAPHSMIYELAISDDLFAVSPYEIASLPETPSWRDYRKQFLTSPERTSVKRSGKAYRVTRCPNVFGAPLVI